MLVIFRQSTKGIALLSGKNRSFSSLFNLQSKSINFNVGHFSAKYQGYSLTVWPKISHFFIMFQSAIKINQFQCWSVFGKIPRVLPYFLAKNRSFSSLSNLQSKSINFNVGHFSAKYQGYSLTFLAKNRSFSSLFNLQSKSINFKCGQLSAKYQGYSLMFWPKIAHFHHFSICNQNQSISMLVIFRQNTKGIALLFGQKSLIFITFQSAIQINQFQCWSFFGKIPRLQPYFLSTNRSCFYNLSICNQNQSISMLVSCQQNTNVIALLFGQKSLIFITSQSAIKLNQFQCWSYFFKIPRLQPYFLAKNRSFSSLLNLQSKSINFNVGHFSSTYQGYSLTFWPKIAHFFIMFQSAIKINQFQCWSFFGKIPRLQPYFLAKNRSFLYNVSMCNQNQSISILVTFRQNTKGIALLFGQKSISFITFQSAIKINQFQFLSFFGKIPRLQPYFLAKNRSFSSLFNLQSKSLNFKCGQLSAKYQGYSLMFWPKIAHFHHFSICN